jgi:hypothetical protein
MMIRPYNKPRDSARSALLTAVRNRRSGALPCTPKAAKGTTLSLLQGEKNLILPAGAWLNTEVRSHQDQRQEAKVKSAKGKRTSSSSAGPGGRQCRLLGFTTLHDSRRYIQSYTILRCLGGPSHPDTKARCAAMMIRPYKLRDSARSALLTAVRNRRSGLAVHPRRVLHYLSLLQGEKKRATQGRGRASSAAACPSLGGRTPTFFTTARRPRTRTAERLLVGPRRGRRCTPASCAGHARRQACERLSPGCPLKSPPPYPLRATAVAVAAAAWRSAASSSSTSSSTCPRYRATNG